jgi:hypothetical protein
MYIFNEKEFAEFRAKHPEQRYFQALRNFLKVDRVEVVFIEDEEMVHEDTFYWQDDK